MAKLSHDSPDEIPLGPTGQPPTPPAGGVIAARHSDNNRTRRRIPMSSNRETRQPIVGLRQGPAECPPTNALCPALRPASRRLHPAGIPDVTGRGAAHEQEGPRPVGRNRVLVSTNQGIPIGAWPRVGLLLRHERQHEQKRLLCGRLGDKGGAAPVARDGDRNGPW